MTHLYHKNNTFEKWNTGAAYLYPLYEMGAYKIITGVACEFIAIKRKQIALLDTGAELSVVGSDIYQGFLDENSVLDSQVGERSINTRLGNFRGYLHRVEICLIADWGDSLTVDGTFLFCEQWTGPTVLGFHGFLERIRFAIDPDYEQLGCIYFAAT